MSNNKIGLHELDNDDVELGGDAVLTLKEFCECVMDNSLIDDDGIGKYAREIDGKIYVSEMYISPSEAYATIHKMKLLGTQMGDLATDFSHVVWYGK